MIRKVISLILIVLAIIVSGFVYFRYQNQLKEGVARIRSAAFPCKQPITYSIGTIDPRFGVSQKDLLADVDAAVKMWEEPTKLNLFSADSSGRVKINLIFDNRQQTTIAQRGIGALITSEQTTYNQLKTKYDELVQLYNNEKASVDSQIAEFESREKQYEARAKAVNDAGGVTPDQAENFQSEKKALEAEAAQVNDAVAKLNALTKNIRDLAVSVNTVVVKLNQHVTSYNNAGDARGRQFEEGQFVSGPEGERIDLFEFDSKQKLVRLIAHELGHALGLEHVENPDGVMFALNQSKSMVLSKEDLAAVETLCHINK
jgi:predicted Zn-dependent protease